MSRPPSPPRAAPSTGLRRLIAALPEAAVLTRDRWESGGVEIVCANERFAGLTGYPAAALAGRNTRILHGPKSRLPAPGAGRNLSGENWLHRRDGTPFFCSWRFARLQPGLLVGIYRDGTAARQLQETVLHTRKIEAIGRLAGEVAHGLNNFLTVINGYCETLEPRLGRQPSARKELQEIHRAGREAAGITRQLLELSRRQEAEARVVNLNTLIRELGPILGRAVGETVRLELRLTSDLGNTRIDPAQFHQVLLNLAFNARDAMPGGGKLTLRTFNRPGAGDDRVGLEVCDTGGGMDNATLACVFEPFFTTKPHGTGLGLPLARRIIEEAGGSITVESEAGAGTRFEILLPETPEPEERSAPAPRPDDGRGRATVWLVEPDAVVRKMAGGVLAAEGFAVREFARPAEAIRATGAAPHLVILDCSDVRAIDLVRKLAADNPRLKVLAVSAGPPALGPEFPVRTPTHLPKPYAFGALLRAVHAQLDASPR